MGGAANADAADLRGLTLIKSKSGHGLHGWTRMEKLLTAKFAKGSREGREEKWRHRPEMGLGGKTGDFQVNILFAPDGKAGGPVFSVDGFTGPGPIFGRKNAGRGGKLGAVRFAAHRAGGNAHLRVVADALELSRVAAGHHVEFAFFFSEPDGGGDGGASLAKSGQQDVLVPVEFGRDRHVGIVAKIFNRRGRRVRREEQGWVKLWRFHKSLRARAPAPHPAGGIGSFVTTYIAHEPQGVLHTRDAQMDARALDAPQERD